MSDAASWANASGQAGDLIAGLAPFIGLIAGVFAALAIGAYLIRYFNQRQSERRTYGFGSGSGFQIGSGLPHAAVRGGRVDTGSLGRSVGREISIATARADRSKDSREESRDS